MSVFGGGCDLYTECTEIEMRTGIISGRGQNWNTCLTPRGAAMAMRMSYAARFKLKVVEIAEASGNRQAGREY